LTLGDRGPEVKELQRKLNQFGAGLDADGDFGPATRGAVIAFQTAKRLSATGVVGKETRAALAL
jgi:peptidoglycan hydrolase-like protein with peptidoglycan-binding domain